MADKRLLIGWTTAGQGLLSAVLPGLMTYDARTNAHAVRLRAQRAAAPSPARDG
ncbi:MULTISPECIES: hypothetical protein [unclassified Streptomyces]|uniref:hypothetical protein n=1 Tax=unclassified Streptomyces TaxID=2593676 RepID=UPI000A401D13|nr:MULTISPECIES: hypothetical protein [unclassified Streptomyces]